VADGRLGDGPGRRGFPRYPPPWMMFVLLSWPILGVVDPRDRLRNAGKRLTDPAEAMAQRVAERVIDLVVEVLDVNALMLRLDLNAVLGRVNLNDVLRRVDVKTLLDQIDVNDLMSRVDLDALMSRVDLDALMARVDVNELVQRIDVEGLVEQTDLGAVIARSSGGVAIEALDSARSQAVGMDQFIDRWVQRVLRRHHPGPAAPGGPDGRDPSPEGRVPSPDGHAPPLSPPGTAQ